MTSLDLLKKNSPKFWWTPILIVILYSFIQGISQEVLFSLFITEPVIIVLSSFLIGLLFIFFWVVIFEKNSIKTLGFFNENIFKNMILGFLGAIVSLIFIISIIYYFKGINFKLIDDVKISFIVISSVLFFLQGVTEEVIFRGYLMNRITSIKGRWYGVIVSSVFFTIFHAANSGENYLSSLNIFLFGIVVALLFWYTDNLWLIAIFHGTWNFLIGIILGINASGIEFPYTLFKATPSENILLSGGSFGVEGSVVTTVYFIIICCIIYMGLYVQMFRRLAHKNK